MRLAIVTAATVAGAALLAGTHPAPTDGYEAAGAIVVPARADAPEDVRSVVRQAAELLRQPSVIGQALERALQRSDHERVLRGLEVDARPDAGVVGFSVRGPTAVAASTLAKALSGAVVDVLQRGRPAGERFGVSIVGDFEVDSDGWRSVGPDYRLAELGLVPGGRYGGGALRVRCAGGDGCGAARVIDGSFRAGRELTLTVWLRSDALSRALVQLGSAAVRDDAAERAVATGRAWQRVVLRWTPASDERQISLQVLSAGGGPMELDLDGALLVTDGPLAEGGERELFAQRGFAYGAPVRVTGVRTGSTVWWALAGAAGGCAIGTAGVVAAALARRRQRRPVERPPRQ